MNTENKVEPNELEIAVGELAAELIKTVMEMTDNKRVWNEAFSIALKVLNGTSEVQIGGAKGEQVSVLENLPGPHQIH